MTFTVFPAIDLRDGKVIRLKEGDPLRSTHYSSEPAAIAEQWLALGARWLHIVNLDAAFDQSSEPNQAAIEAIVKVAERHSAMVQSGGGIRTTDDVQKVLDLGISRAILGTMLVEHPEQAAQAVSRWGSSRIVAGIDARDGLVKTHGWAEGTAFSAIEFAQRLAAQGFEWVVYTDIARDGMSTGINLSGTRELAEQSGLKIIASGGVRSSEDVYQVQAAGLAGVIVGRALYEGSVDLGKLLTQVESRKG